jgi:hypothetical protein
MAFMAIDTLSIAQELREAELPSGQAEAIASAIGRTLTEGAATKADLKEVESRIDRLEISIDGKLDRFKVEMFRWFLASTLTIIGAVIAAAKLS